MFYNIKMKLLIGGKSRNIYMRKDGSAYYKSGGQQVDVTYMFKKKGGGLKKKYIKGGTTEQEFDSLKDKCNKLNERLKALHDKLTPHTFTASGSSETTTKDFIASIIKEFYVDNKSLNELADEINGVSTSYTDGGVQKFEALMKLLKEDEVSKGIKSLLSTGGDGTIRKALDEIAVGTEVDFNTKKPELLGKLEFFANVITEIGKIDGTPDENGETNTASTKGVDINTTLSVNVLSEFDANIDKFNENFFNLAHLVISVMNAVYTGGDTLRITSDNDKEIEKLVQKLNALINLFYNSLRADGKGNEGVFITSGEKFTNEVLNQKKISKFKTVYLQIDRTSQDHTYSIKKKDSFLNNDILSKIFRTFGSICKSIETPRSWGRTAGVNPVSKEAIARNIHAFLSGEDVLAKEITIPPLPR